MSQKENKAWIIGAAKRFFASGVRGVLWIPESIREHCGTVVVKIHDAEDHEDHDGVYTWRSKPSIWVTLIQARDRETLMILHDDDGGPMEPLKMSHSSMLSADCPPGTCLFGQVIFDCGILQENEESDDAENKAAKTPIPRIMIFDVLSLGCDIDTTVLPPKKRYRILRESCGRFVNGSSVQIQWAGDREPTEKFCSGGRARLPHEVDSIIKLSKGHPLYVGVIPKRSSSL